MFPGGGQVARPRGITSVVNGNDEEVFSRPVERQRIISEQSAFQMVTMLRDVIDRGTGSPARTLGVRGAFGGKTGKIPLSLVNTAKFNNKQTVKQIPLDLSGL